MTALVIGIGQPDRCDDAAGLAVVAAVRRLAPDVAVTELATPVRLVDAWEGYDDVIVVDAVKSGRAAGDVTVLQVGTAAMPVRPGAGGSHGFGVAEAIELARAIDRLPTHLVLVGIEATDFTPGRGMSTAVAGAVETAAGEVLDLLRARTRAGER